MLEISDDKFLDENYDVTVGDGAIVLTSWSDGHNHLYLYSYDKAKPLAADAKLDTAADQAAISKWAMCTAWTPRTRWWTTHRTKAIRWSSRSGR